MYQRTDDKAKLATMEEEVFGEDRRDAEIKRLRKALEIIAGQATVDELLEIGVCETADFVGGYDILIDIARAALENRDEA